MHWLFPQQPALEKAELCVHVDIYAYAASIEQIVDLPRGLVFFVDSETVAERVDPENHVHRTTQRRTGGAETCGEVVDEGFVASDHELDLIPNLRLQTLGGIDTSGLDQLLRKVRSVRPIEAKAALVNHRSHVNQVHAGAASELDDAESVPPKAFGQHLRYHIAINGAVLMVEQVVDAVASRREAIFQDGLIGAVFVEVNVRVHRYL